MEFEEYLIKCRFCLHELDDDHRSNIISPLIQQQFYDLTQIYVDLSLSEYSKIVCERCKLNLQIFSDLRQEFIQNQDELDGIIQNAKLHIKLSENESHEDIKIKAEPLDLLLDDSFEEEIIEYIDEPPPVKNEYVKNESNDFPCKFCKLKFNDVKLLENHNLNKHKKLLSVSEIREIRKRRIDDRKLVCPVCGIRTHYIKNHMERTHLNVKRYFCDHCGHRAFYKSEMVLHMLTHKQSSFICDYCGKIFKRKSALKRHIRRLHLHIPDTIKYKRKGPPASKKKNPNDENAERIRCQYCEKDILWSYFKSHVEQVHTISESREVCNICQKTFKNKRALIYHKRNHKERIYKCDYPNCTKAFFIEKRLIYHKSVHKNIREFKCPHDGCDKSYFIKRVLNMHIALHHQKFTRNCPVSGCNFSVGRKDYMRNHVTKQHKDLPADSLNYYIEKVKEMQLW